MSLGRRGALAATSWTAFLLAALLASPTFAQPGPAYGLLVVAPVESAAAAEAVAAVAAALGPAAPTGTRTVRRCEAADGAVTASLLAAAFDRAQQQFFLGRFEEAERELREWLEALATGCRPLSSVPEGWTASGPVAALHDLGALLLATARELDRVPDAEATLRRLLGLFPGARPTDGMFPPSLADRYLDLEPDETEVGWVVVDAPGCAANVAGRVVAGRTRVPAGSLSVGLSCPEEEAFVVQSTVAPGETLRLTAPATALSAGASRGERTLVRMAATAAALAREACGVAVDTRAGQVRVAVWRAPDEGGVLGPVTDVAAVEPWIRNLLARAPAAGESDAGVGWWGPLALGVAGAALGAGGAWALVDAEDRRALAARAATASTHERLVEEAGSLEAAGWALVGVGAAALVGAAVWLVLELAGGTETPPDGAAEGAVVPLVGPRVLGLGLAF